MVQSNNGTKHPVLEGSVANQHNWYFGLLKILLSNTIVLIAREFTAENSEIELSREIRTALNNVEQFECRAGNLKSLFSCEIEATYRKCRHRLCTSLGSHQLRCNSCHLLCRIQALRDDKRKSVRLASKRHEYGADREESDAAWYFWQGSKKELPRNTGLLYKLVYSSYVRYNCMAW